MLNDIARNGNSRMGAVRPREKDVVALPSVETNEMIRYFSLRRSNIAFTESVRHQGKYTSARNLDRSPTLAPHKTHSGAQQNRCI